MMIKKAFWPAMAAMTVIAATSAVYAAPGDAVDHVRGQVSAADSTAKTITVTNPRDQTATTFKVTDATKYTVDVAKTLDSLKVGDNIRVMGQPDDTGNVEARFIMVVPAGQGAGRPGGGGPGGRGGRRGGTTGVIATVKPALTITTADAKTVTVTTTADTRVTGPQAGSWSDVKTGTFVTADVTGDSGSQVASAVHVSANMGFGRGGGGGRRQGGGGAGGDAPPPPAQ
ncbi:hypothetical protein CCAX7_27180 [Capsulimonas corticalis]|uniref:Uncharacterized protein n=1 Tax=Capsulimonas corticalis TaxID=2219043 RepID=A0A402CTL7_9BACT|nr:DUF5666 domain-containing protein [Capsulimonas corticalis]BDI30667.1 hypothetical protein CCAX7_27180 [Capsulimonas corticalis]